ncbi:hypothetical protein NDU88_002487 [Pleurodeles waltl]|uniref:Uncharacterized protein n=1 Tax=Pleurodeles waltl TaxID=8319 RepID=A0AAV7SDD2_PLEWA|nr:hypothetical protein NDU88_002487 [Pleurodeles waltl]
MRLLGRTAAKNAKQAQKNRPQPFQRTEMRNAGLYCGPKKERHGGRQCHSSHPHMPHEAYHFLLAGVHVTQLEKLSTCASYNV